MKVALISCVKTKANESCQAKDMYQSNWFKKAYAYAQQHTDKILILSAKYHVLETTDKIEPYDLTLKNMTAAQRCEWAKEVLNQLAVKTDFEHDEFLILAGEIYRRDLIGVLKNCLIPMKGLSQGEQLQFLKEALKV